LLLVIKAAPVCGWVYFFSSFAGRQLVKLDLMENLNRPVWMVCYWVQALEQALRTFLFPLKLKGEFGPEGTESSQRAGAVHSRTLST